MLKSYEHAVSSGTANNRLRQAKVYIGFAVAYNIKLLAPSVADTALFVQYLANSFKSPGTVKNYLSGAKLWISQHGGTVGSFVNPQVSEVLKGTEKLSEHIPSPAKPITNTELLIISKFLDRFHPNAIPHKAALLLGYSCFLRSSNLLSNQNVSNVDTHALLCQDVLQVQSGLKVFIRSSKTISPKNPVVLTILPAPMSPLCPVQAWNNYIKMFNPTPAGPAFVSATGQPVNSKSLVKLIRLALQRAGYKDCNSFSIHSAAALGASPHDLKAHGTWRSDKGLKSYVNISSSVPRLLASSLPRY